MRVGAGAAKAASLTALPTWPPLLATAGPGGRSGLHRHHAMHLVLCRRGTLRVRVEGGAWSSPIPGVLTAPDVPHAIDASGADVLLVFIDPESHAGSALRGAFSGALRVIDDAERSALLAGGEPSALMGADGVAWTARVAATLGAGELPVRVPVHPRVRKLLRLLRERPPRSNVSLDALAELAGLSPSRLMHAFTASIGLPLRPYLAWLRVQRAAGAIVAGVPLGQAALAAGFADNAHMSRTFKRMLGVTPSELRAS